MEKREKNSRNTINLYLQNKGSIINDHNRNDKIETLRDPPADREIYATLNDLQEENYYRTVTKPQHDMLKKRIEEIEEFRPIFRGYFLF